MNTTALESYLDFYKLFLIKHDYTVRIWYYFVWKSYTTHTHINFATNIFGQQHQQDNFIPWHGVQKAFLTIMCSLFKPCLQWWRSRWRLSPEIESVRLSLHVCSQATDVGDWKVGDCSLYVKEIKSNISKNLIYHFDFAQKNYK